ncbi:hepatic lectin isoform X1 [Xenopus laevis]|uniref:Hepatic lectin isoform X1 n=1 Tax=Xenopus laevis TaxID=8355 RepID=A0A8J1MMZ4_XENLA|nr:hepatic lectin isoform X1 [Xenopus laevis]
MESEFHTSFDRLHSDPVSSVKKTFSSRQKPLVGIYCLLAVAYILILALFITVMTKSTPGSTDNNDLKNYVAQLASKVNEIEEKIAQLASKVNETEEKIAQPASKVNETEEKKEACDSAWINFEDSCYYITTKKTNWEKARSFCVQEGGDLAVINSEKEQTFLKEKSGVSRINRFWIGLNDLEEEGTWTWVDGTDYSTSYQFWTKGEPNDHLKNEDCAHLWNFTGEWNDVHCTFEVPYAICEKKIKT